MADSIDREHLKKTIKAWEENSKGVCSFDDIYDIIDSEPKARRRPEKKKVGRWMYGIDGMPDRLELYVGQCSVCKGRGEVGTYCIHCGARLMD